jgi:hypothetical protein
MRELRGHLRYGAVNISRRYTLIGVVSGESPLAYAVPLARGMRQWTIGQEPSIRIALNGPDPALPLRSGTTRISFTTWASAGYPRVDLWADGRRVDLLRGQRDSARSGRYVWAVDHNGATRLLPGRHVIVAVVRPGGALITARAWVLTVRS